MSWLSSVTALSILAFAGEAQAAKYGYCYVDFGVGPEATRYVSGIIEVASKTEAQGLSSGGSFREAFLDHVRSRYEPNASTATCETWETLNDTRRAAFDVAIPSDGIRVRTEWLGGKANVLGQDKARISQKEVPVVTQNSAAIQTPRKQSNPDSDFDAKMSAYEEELAKQKAAVAEFERAQAEVQKGRAENAERAKKALADWERAVAACKAGDDLACTRQPE